MGRARKNTANVDIKIRMKEPLRADIERAAKRRGVSMNAEMNDRLASSFDREALFALKSWNRISVPDSPACSSWLEM